MHRLLLACACALFAATCASASNDDRIVPAHEEPRHVPQLVNEWIRVIDVAIPQGEQTLFHARIHSTIPIS